MLTICGIVVYRPFGHSYCSNDFVRRETNSSIWILQKQIGAYNFLQMQQGLEGIGLATLTRSGEWTPEEVQVLVAKARQDLSNPRIHGQYDL